jgi:hypothetical protein
MHRILEAGPHTLILEVKLMKKAIEHSPLYLVIPLHELKSGAECLHANVEVILVVTNTQIQLVEEAHILCLDEVVSGVNL